MEYNYIMSDKIYDFMHKNIKLASVALDDSNRITDVWDVRSGVFFPVCANAGVSVEDFTNWLNGRSVPVSRMENEHLRNGAVFNSMGLSLTDCYWFRPKGEDLAWEDVNFYTNGFSEEVGRSFFTGGQVDTSSVSPDFSLNGNLKKCWKYTGSGILLLKRGGKPYQKEPFCEKIASQLALRMGMPHVEYSFEEDEEGYYSVCKSFTDEHNELLNAKNFIRTERKSENTDDFNRFLDKCKACGISDIETITDKMIVFDYLMLNVDRHWGNFGVIRDSNTGDIKGMAPVYDTGMSLSREYGMVFDKMSDSGYKNIMLGADMNRSLDYVKDFGNINVNGLSDFDEYIVSVLGNNKYMPESDIRDIAMQFKERLEHVIKMKNTQKST